MVKEKPMITAVIPHNKNWYEDAFKRVVLSTANVNKTSIQKIKEEGFKNFSRLGFPSTRNEDWKYTDLSKVARTEYDRTSLVASFDKEVIQKHLGVELSGVSLFVVDGKVSLPKEGMPSGLKISSLMAGTDLGMLQSLDRIADATNNPLVAFNSAFFEDVIGIEVSEGAKIETPINLVLINSGEEKTVRFPRILVKLAADSEVTLSEIHIGVTSNDALSVSVTEVEVAEGARCEHVKLILEGQGATHLGHFAVKMAEKSFYRSHCLTFGGRLVRSEISPHLGGENIECHLQGLTVIGNDQHVDNHTVLDHANPNCHSDEMYKGVYDNKASGVFSGTIIVRKDAQKTDAIQSNRSILLSPTAKIETRPCLKIWADDVKCTHGATVGQLDEDSLFYLRARGIPADEARNMLLKAFMVEVIEKLPTPEIQKAVELRILRSK
jgi:Fe-S cluster assembly protein SufD